MENDVAFTVQGEEKITKARSKRSGLSFFAYWSNSAYSAAISSRASIKSG